MSELAKLDAAIADLEEEIEWSGYTEANRRKRADLERQRRSLQRDRAQTVLESRILPGISLARYDAMEAERRYLRRQLTKIALGVAKLRGNDLTGFALRQVERYENDEDTHESFHCSLSRSARYEPEWSTVSFPVSYLDDDWEEIETTAAKVRLAEAQAEKDRLIRERLDAQEARDRAEFERLSKKFTPA